MHLPPDYPDLGQPAAPVHSRPYDRTHHIHSNFQAMAGHEGQRKSWTFIHRPCQRPLATCGTYYIVHLYSGWRRDCDFQHWMEFCLDKHHAAMRNSIHMISVDTAIHPSMNIRFGTSFGPCACWQAALCFWDLHVKHGRQLANIP